MDQGQGSHLLKDSFSIKYLDIAPSFIKLSFIAPKKSRGNRHQCIESSRRLRLQNVLPGPLRDIFGLVSVSLCTCVRILGVIVFMFWNKYDGIYS